MTATNDRFDQFNMSPPESAAVVAAFVQDSHQIHHDVNAREQSTQLLKIMNVSLDELETR
jgi:hypothetical protein